MGWFSGITTPESPVDAVKTDQIRVDRESETETRESNIVTIKKQTNRVLAAIRRKEKVVPNLTSTERDRLTLEAIERIGMPNQKEAFLYQARCRQMEELGFRKFTNLEDILAYFLGKENLGQDFQPPYRGTDSFNYSWVYDHRKGKVVAKNFKGFAWTCQSYVVDLGRNMKTPFWRWGPADMLARPIPTGALLSMAEVKELNIVNQFNAIAPDQEWLLGNQIPERSLDPIVVGSVWRMGDQESTRIQEQSHYFIAMWE